MHSNQQQLAPLLFTFFLACFFSTSLQASQLAEPQGAVILTVSGNIQHKNLGEQAVFDRQMLESLEQKQIITDTPWTEGSNPYQGPLGRALIEAVGADQATQMIITALNDYQSKVPVSDFFNYPIILALQKNDRYLRIRDRGPLFIIYPFDDHPHLHTEMHYNRSVWQVKAIEFQ